MTRRRTEREVEPEPEVDAIPMVERPVIAVPATKLVNTSGKAQNFPGMGAENVKPGRSIPLPKDLAHVQFLKNHGFELA